ncbi:MAG TPA: C40 family peptidase [Gemmatimonadaceae bacterium]|nr:C40 family peptidase [Gemmatimonadaceae bacterium]
MQLCTSARSLRLVLCSLLACTLVALPRGSAGAQGPARIGTAARRKPFTDWSESAQSLRDSLVSVARAQVGTRYVFGGTTPNRGFDCSGLIRYVMSSLKVELPRTAAQQARIGHEVSPDPKHLRPGDLLTFSRRGSRGVSHIGIYVGEGRYVHASSVAGRVIESDLSRTGSPLIKAWRGVRRIVAGAEPDSASVRNGDG